MNKTLRILGKRGRITVPYEIRTEIGFSSGDVVSFAVQNDKSVLVRREKICDGCIDAEQKKTDEITLLEFLDQLSKAEQNAALIHLSLKYGKELKDEL